jgi:hypothetical protein
MGETFAVELTKAERDALEWLVLAKPDVWASDGWLGRMLDVRFVLRPVLERIRPVGTRETAG